MKKIFAVIICLLFVLVPVQGQVNAKLAKDFSNVLIREECVAAHMVGDSKAVIDSLVPQNFVSNCFGYQGAIAFVRDTEVSNSNISYLNNIILRDRPDFIVMCGMKREDQVICAWR